MRCTNCGAELKEQARFCNQCGTPVKFENNDIHNNERKEESEEMIAGNDSASSKKKWKDQYTILILVIAMCVAGAAGIIVKSMASKETDTDYNRSEVSDTCNPSETATEHDGDEEDGNDVGDSEITYDYTEEGIHVYGFFIDDCTWTEAFAKAQEKDGYLVHINSYEEYEYIVSQIYEMGYENIQFRIGGRRDADSLEYYWVDEYNSTYGDIINSPEYWADSEWMQGEPSYNDGDIEEDCLDFYYYEKEDRWVWNDVPDDIISIVPYYSGKIGYIVEYED